METSATNSPPDTEAECEVTGLMPCLNEGEHGFSRANRIFETEIS